MLEMPKRGMCFSPWLLRGGSLVGGVIPVACTVVGGVETFCWLHHRYSPEWCLVVLVSGCMVRGEGLQWGRCSQRRQSTLLGFGLVVIRNSVGDRLCTCGQVRVREVSPWEFQWSLGSKGTFHLGHSYMQGAV